MISLLTEEFDPNLVRQPYYEVTNRDRPDGSVSVPGVLEFDSLSNQRCSGQREHEALTVIKH